MIKTIRVEDTPSSLSFSGMIRGTTLMVNSGLTFQQLFLIVCGIYAVAAAVWVILVPFSLRIHGIGSSQKPTREQTIRVMKNKSAMLVAFANIFFNILQDARRASCKMHKLMIQ